MKRKSATTIAADDKLKSAFRLIGRARMVLTLRNRKRLSARTSTISAAEGLSAPSAGP
jgi:hypothetical protein